MTKNAISYPPIGAVESSVRLEKVVFISRVKAERLTPPANAVIISIHDVSEPPASLGEGWVDRLTLCFHDTDKTDSVLTGFSGNDARRVIAFVEKHAGSAEKLYIHCALGISRSAGAALALSELYDVPCFADNFAVSFENYKVYNRLVYRKIMMADSEKNQQV